jgi:ABC-type transport system involved in cytochrome c biogenesis permease subunit
MALVGVVLMLLVTGLRWGLGKKIPWFKTPRGGVTLAFGTALLATIGGALAAGQPFSFEIVMAAISVAFTAGGIHTRVTSAIEAHAAKKTKTPS